MHLPTVFYPLSVSLYERVKKKVWCNGNYDKCRCKKFCARIAMGNYDAIIIGHSQFERIPISDERQKAMLRKQIDDLEMFNKCQYLDEITGEKGITFP